MPLSATVSVRGLCRGHILALLFCYFEAWSAELVRGPYLQTGTPNSVIIKWRTDEPTNSIVLYGDAPDDLRSVAGSVQSTTEHQVRVSGLAPATRYFYSIGSFTERLAGGDSNHFFVTHPVVGRRKPTRIWALGDCGTASAGHPGSGMVRDAYYQFAGTN